MPNLECTKCKAPFEKNGTKQIKIRYPWFPQDPDFELINQADFKPYREGSDLEILELKRDDTGTNHPLGSPSTQTAPQHSQAFPTVKNLDSWCSVFTPGRIQKSRIR